MEVVPYMVGGKYSVFVNAINADDANLVVLRILLCNFLMLFGSCAVLKVFVDDADLLLAGVYKC